MKQLLRILIIIVGVPSFVFPMIPRSSEEQNALNERLLTKNLKTLQEALDAGAHVNARIERQVVREGKYSYETYEDFTPLHYAAAHGCVSIVRALISFGADLGALDKNGRTPLHCSSTGQVAHMLLTSVRSAGIDVIEYLNKADFDGKTALYYKSYQPDVAQVLIASGASARIKDDNIASGASARIKDDNPILVKRWSPVGLSDFFEYIYRQFNHFLSVSFSYDEESDAEDEESDAEDEESDAESEADKEGETDEGYAYFIRMPLYSPNAIARYIEFIEYVLHEARLLPYGEDDKKQLSQAGEKLKARLSDAQVMLPRIQRVEKKLMVGTHAKQAD